MEKEGINLKDRKEGTQQGLKGGKGMGTWCNYIIISKKNPKLGSARSPTGKSCCLVRLMAKVSSSKPMVEGLN